MTIDPKKLKEEMRKAKELLESNNAEIAKVGNADRIPKATAGNKHIPVTQQNERKAQNQAAKQAKSPGMKQKDQLSNGPGGIPRDAGEHRLRHVQNISTFDIKDPKNSQIIADCKKHRTQGHKLSENCKKLLAMVDAAQRGRGEGAAGPEGQTAAGAPYTDLDAYWEKGRTGCDHASQYGDELSESEKYFTDVEVKNYHASQNQDPYTFNHHIRPANCHGYKCKGCRYVEAPLFDTAKYKEQQTKKLLQEYFQDPEAFKARHSDFSYETIVIRSVLKNAEEGAEGEEEEDPFMGAGEPGMGGVEAPQPLASSESEMKDTLFVGMDDVKKARVALAKCQSSEANAEKWKKKLKAMGGQKK